MALGRMRGKLPPRHDPRVVHYGAMRSALGASIPTIPDNIDWMKGIDRDALGTLGNAPDPEFPNEPMVGDCGVVGMFRFIQAESYKLKGEFLSGTVLTPCAYQAYSEITGWNANDPSSDTGINLQDGLTYWMNKGIPLPNGTRHKIVGFFKVDFTNDAELREVIAVCGGAYVGQDIPDAWDSAGPGSVWSVEGPGTGGHCTDIMSYGPSFYDMESWAMRFQETIEAKNTYMDEAWAVISPTWANATGQTPFNMSLNDVHAAMAALNA
jgi:hypothetical protein